MKGVDRDAIVKKMVGREVTRLTHSRSQTNGAELLSVAGLRLKTGTRYVIKDVNLTLQRGEILGIFGLMGAGRTELLECILGLHGRHCTGDVLIEGRPARVKSPGEAIRSGLALVPEDRKRDGFIPGLDVKTNISLSSLGAGFLDYKKETNLALHYKDSLRIKTASLSQQVRHLSGGNQQKVVLARCLATQPKVLMLDEPTRGIDVNAKTEIYRLILELSESGLGIIVVSSELPEILAISDRILVMCEGKMTGAFSRADASEDEILKAAIPKNDIN